MWRGFIEADTRTVYDTEGKKPGIDYIHVGSQCSVTTRKALSSFLFSKRKLYLKTNQVLVFFQRCWFFLSEINKSIT